MTNNTLVPLAPRFFNHQLTSQYFLIPTLGHPTQDIVLTRRNPFATGPAEGKNMHPIPFEDREPMHKRTSLGHDFIFDHAQYRSVFDGSNTSTKYTHMQDLSDTYDSDGILKTSSMSKGMYIDLFL